MDGYLQSKAFCIDSLQVPQPLEMENGLGWADRWYKGWGKGSKYFPRVAVIARRYLFITPNQDGLERIFSLCKRVATDKSALRLDPRTLDAKIALKINFS